MDLKLFFSTFVLIFLAELGDKTQLAALAQSAGAKSPWSVFLGAAAALVLSTLVAVLVGANLEKLVNPKHIRLAAGILFLVFGTLLIIEVTRGKKEAEAAAVPARGVLTGFVMDLAAEFEQAAHLDYLALAEKSADASHRELFLALAGEEKAHGAFLRGLPLGELELAEPALAVEPLRETLLHDVALAQSPELRHAIEHEEATAAFYEELSRSIKIASLKAAFHEMAVGERNHANRLRQLISA